eukprot:8906319-Ditylum_brightwellii.AAC.1
MVHSCNGMLDDVDGNNIGCLTPHDNSAETEGTLMFHGVDGGVNCGESHLTHLTQEVDCCLMERKKQNVAKSNDGKEVNVGVGDCVNNHFNGRVDSHVNDSVNAAVEDGVDG